MANEFPAHLNAVGTRTSAELIVRICAIASLTAIINTVFLDHLVIRECICGGVGSSASAKKLPNQRAADDRASREEEDLRARTLQLMRRAVVGKQRGLLHGDAGVG